MTKSNIPYIIKFKRNGDSSMGYISIAEEQSQIPFEIKRIFWTYYTPEEVFRGKHAHHLTEMVLIAAAGSISVKTELIDGSIQEFVLDKPDKGLFIPTMCWHTMQYSHNAVQIVIASSLFDENDYIRSYDQFKT